MDQFENISKIYIQAPWRKQLQLVVLIALGLVLIALVAGIYLSISARATAIGRDIQSMQLKISTADRENEDMQSQLARILSSSQMEARARSIGFEPINPDQIVYLPVPGYRERKPVTLGGSSQRPLVGAIAMPPEYTESIFEWLAKKIYFMYHRIVAEST